MRTCRYDIAQCAHTLPVVEREASAENGVDPRSRAAAAHLFQRNDRVLQPILGFIHNAVRPLAELLRFFVSDEQAPW